MKHVGKNIKLLRQKNGWSQGIVAKRLNISIPAFSKIETCATDINLTRLGQLANVFNVSITEIIGQTGETTDKYEVELEECKRQLLAKEREVSHLQKKIIILYDELTSR
jgi:transcriptional regulator with XRE-family HTH domain